jgi:hypothetical protein
VAAAHWAWARNMMTSWRSDTWLDGAPLDQVGEGNAAQEFRNLIAQVFPQVVGQAAVLTLAVLAAAAAGGVPRIRPRREITSAIEMTAGSRPSE